MARFSRYLVWIYAAILLAIIILAIYSLSGAETTGFDSPDL